MTLFIGCRPVKSEGRRIEAVKGSFYERTDTTVVNVTVTETTLTSTFVVTE